MSDVQTDSCDLTTGAITMEVVSKMLKLQGIDALHIKKKKQKGLLHIVNKARAGRWFIVKDLKDSFRVHCIGVFKTSINTGLVFDDSHQFAIIFEKDTMQKLVDGRTVLDLYRVSKK